MGVTRMTRAFGIPSKASPVIGVGGQFGTSLMAKDRRLIEGTIKLEKVVKEIPSPNFRKVINHRYLPNVSQGKQDEPLVNDLVQVQSRDSVVSDIWSGSADLKIYESSDSELAELQPTRVLSGCRFSFSTTVDDLKILKDLKK
jgi:acetoacetate decarboxylase